MCHYLLKSLEGVQCEGEGKYFVQRATKDVLERRLACSQSLRCCVPAAGSALKVDPVYIKEVKFHKLEEKEAEKNPDLVWMQCCITMPYTSSNVDQKLKKQKKQECLPHDVMENLTCNSFDVFEREIDDDR